MVLCIRQDVADDLLTGLNYYALCQEAGIEMFWHWVVIKVENK